MKNILQGLKYDLVCHSKTPIPIKTLGSSRVLTPCSRESLQRSCSHFMPRLVCLCDSASHYFLPLSTSSHCSVSPFEGLCLKASARGLDLHFWLHPLCPIEALWLDKLASPQLRASLGVSHPVTQTACVFLVSGLVRAAFGPSVHSQCTYLWPSL